MPGEFSHHSGCRNRDPDNCGGCALTTGGSEGPNYAAWPLAYMENGRTIPAKWIGAFKREIERTDNRAYADYVRHTAAKIGARFSDGTTFNGTDWTEPHRHTVQDVTRFPSGRSLEHCDCGAHREVGKDGKPAPSWHTCALCTHNYGLDAR